MSTIAEALDLAVQHHQAGNLARAEQIYRQILEANPADPNALHLLGMLVHQVGQHQAALPLLQKAVAVMPHVAEFHSHLAGVYLTLGQLAPAEGCYREALRLQPDAAQGHYHVGLVLARQEKWDEAVASYEQALRLKPDYVEALNNLANVLKQMGRLKDAEARYREALSFGPDRPEIHHNLAAALEGQGRFPEAEDCYRQALRLKPDLAETHNNLGNVLRRRGRLAQAEGCYREALRLVPGHADALNHLGVALAEQGRLEEALASYREALRVKPDLAGAHYNQGLALAVQRKYDEAQACFEQALLFQPDYAEALDSLATAFKEQGFQEEPIACYRKAVAAKPELQYLHSNLLTALHYSHNYDPKTIFAEHRRWAGQFGTSPVRHRPLQPIDRDPARRLRIGYVSRGFCEVGGVHSCEAVIGAHDHGPFEVFCYATVTHPDALTQRVRASADHWRPIADLSDARAADLIRQDRIDLLIDLAGHSANNRLGVFACKPAPIQVTYFGYPDTTGLAAIDYRLTDANGDPPGQTERFHTEELVRLPEIWWCYAPPPGPEVNPLPAQKAGQVTFGSLNSLAKVTERMIRLWSQIMSDLPESRIVVVTGAGRAADERVPAAFGKHGISSERVRLAGRERRDAYLRLYHGVDIALDTFPLTGGFTTADALWMGVPVISLAGPTFVTRQAVAILSQVGLEDLVTETPAAYVEAATSLARDLPRLRALRAQLRQRLAHSPLGDVPRLTRQLEAAYRAMWERYCRD